MNISKAGNGCTGLMPKESPRHVSQSNYSSSTNSTTSKRRLGIFQQGGSPVADPIVFERVIDATVDEAFALFTEPERLRRWQAVSAYGTFTEIDPR